MDDATVEQEIKAKGLDVAPRVTKDQIDALMARVIYLVIQPPGTTTTIAHAFLDANFFLSMGFAACVDPANFNAEIGERMARESAEQRARERLWELEGYALYQKKVNGDAYDGARGDLLEWKGRAQRAEARLAELGEKGWQA